MRRPSLAPAAVIILASTLTAGCITSGPAGTGHPSDARTIVVGVSGAFAENQLIAEMYAQVLEHAGFTVGREFELRSRDVSQSALESGHRSEARVHLVAAAVPRLQGAGVERSDRCREADR